MRKNPMEQIAAQESEESRLIVHWGCAAAEGALRERDFLPHALADLEALLPPQGQKNLKLARLNPRAFVFHADRIKENDEASFLDEVRSQWPLVDIVVWAPAARAERVREILRHGAKDVVLSPAPDLLASTLDFVVSRQTILPHLRQQPGRSTDNSRFEKLFSRSMKMWDIFDYCARIAPTSTRVLILGETGTGKELIARAIHQRSARKGRFVALNCAAIPESLIDSELFGHVKGAFTGATSNKRGLFGQAEGGTLFLDEIANMPLTAQYHLLRVLQERVMRPVGSDTEVNVDVRVIAATSRSLEEELIQGRFREDLFYRLDVVRIVVPPLRERPEDVLFLFSHFLRRFAKLYNVVFPSLSEGFIQELLAHPWPGNVRQLENIAERLILSKPNQRLTAQNLKSVLRLPKSSGSPHSLTGNAVHSSSPSVLSHSSMKTSQIHTDQPNQVNLNLDYDTAVRKPMREIESHYLKELFRHCGGKMNEAAQVSGLSRRTLLRKLREHGLKR